MDTKDTKDTKETQQSITDLAGGLFDNIKQMAEDAMSQAGNTVARIAEAGGRYVWSVKER
ncbi:MAG: hypothetical protein ACHBN1_32670 [Heteroscytonema crispum UTEX LB 1556]